jgi:hypothetical protein
MTTKPATGRDAKVLAAVRRLFRDGFLLGADARALGVVGGSDSFAFGDALNPLVREAGRASGFGSDAIDAKISDYLARTYGRGNWERDRPPHPWELGGGDQQLDQLYVDDEGCAAERQRRLDALWAQRDAISAAFAKPKPKEVIAALVQELADLTEQFQEANKRADLARGRRVTRQVFLQEQFRRREASRGR